MDANQILYLMIAGLGGCFIGVIIGACLADGSEEIKEHVTEEVLSIARSVHADVVSIHTRLNGFEQGIKDVLQETGKIAVPTAKVKVAKKAKAKP